MMWAMRLTVSMKGLATNDVASSRHVYCDGTSDDLVFRVIRLARVALCGHVGIGFCDSLLLGT